MSPQDVSRWLFDTAPGPPGAAYFLPFAFFLLVLVGSAAVFFLRRSLFPGHGLHIRLAKRYGSYGMVSGGAGLFFLAARYFQFTFFQARIFLVLSVIDVFALAIYFFWYYRNRYPADLAAYERAKERERFVRASAHSARRRARKSRR